jgi:hypothetical protein
MSQTRIGSRIVVIAGTAPADGKPGYRKPTGRRPNARRTVVIRNGEWIRTRRGR